jgi:hypothetical protein
MSFNTQSSSCEFVCTQCQENFSTKAKLHYHSCSFHQTSANITLKSIVIDLINNLKYCISTTLLILFIGKKISITRDPVIKKFVCSCSGQFITPNSLNKHMVTCNSALKQYGIINHNQVNILMIAIII